MEYGVGIHYERLIVGLCRGFGQDVIILAGFAQ